MTLIPSLIFRSSPIGTTARPESFVNKQNLQWAMNEVWSLREKASPPTTPSTTQMPPPPPSPTTTSYPFELPERRNTLRSLIEEFRRSEHQLGDGDRTWSASSLPAGAVVGGIATTWKNATQARRQLLKAPPPPRQTTNDASAMKKSASVWYATPPAPDRPGLVSRMSMPNLMTSQQRSVRERQHQSNTVTDRIPEEHWFLHNKLRCGLTRFRSAIFCEGCTLFNFKVVLKFLKRIF